MAIAKKRVARLMKTAAMAGVSRRRTVRTTRSDPKHHPASDLVRRNFVVDAPNHLWVADITPPHGASAMGTPDLTCQP